MNNKRRVILRTETFERIRLRKKLQKKSIAKDLLLEITRLKSTGLMGMANELFLNLSIYVRLSLKRMQRRVTRTVKASDENNEKE